LTQAFTAQTEPELPASVLHKLQAPGPGQLEAHQQVPWTFFTGRIVIFNCQHELFWELETLTGQTGKQNGSQTPIHLHDSFPKTTGSVHWESQ